MWGASGHASVVADIIDVGGRYEVAAFYDPMNPGREGSEFLGRPVVCTEESLIHMRNTGAKRAVVAFGDCAARVKAAKRLEELHFMLLKTIHPAAVVSEGSDIGPGTVIAAGAIIGPGCRIGANVIINHGATVDHDCIVEDGANICPGVNLGGRVRIGRCAWVGIGSVVIEKVSIGAGAFIGAGTVVIKNIPENVMAVGCPARIVKQLGVED